jgi:hypothetical protein
MGKPVERRAYRAGFLISQQIFNIALWGSAARSYNEEWLFVS